MNSAGPNRGGAGQRSDKEYARRSRRAQKSVELLPDPEVLESYNYVIEGAGERILEMFEKEQQHRHEWEDQALKVHAFNSVLAQMLGFLVMMVALGASIYFGRKGDYTMAVFLGVFSFSSLIWAYIRTVNRRPLGKKFDTRPQATIKDGMGADKSTID